MSTPARVAADMEQAAKAGYDRMTKVVRKYAQLGLAKVRANASGRPGPRRVTGDYKRDMNIEYDGPFLANISTGKPQGPRLEFGFVGEDKLGRHYNQPPFPHWGPMADWLMPQFQTAVAEAIVE